MAGERDGGYVCVVGGGYPSDAYVRHGIFEFDWARALHTAGISVIYAAVDLRSIRRRRHWGMEHLSKDGVEIYAINVPVGKMPADFCEFIGKIALWHLYHKMVREHGKPLLIHSHFLTQSVMASEVCEKEKIPLAVTEHSSSLDKDVISRSCERRAKKAYSHAAIRIAVSNSLSRHLKATTGYDFCVVHNMVDMKAFPYRRKKNTGAFVFAITGNLILSKGHRYLLDACKEIVSRYPNTFLWIFGEGPEHGNIINQMCELGIVGNVKMFGNVDRSVIGTCYASVDAFVLPSEHETFGVAYIEAMASGIPVIATRCGGPEDFVTPENGILIEVGDESELVEAMEYMILHRKNYNGKMISEYAKDNFAPNYIASQIRELYCDILGKAGEKPIL